MSALLALLSSCLWGLSDFLGGTASRRLPVLSVLGLSQLSGLLLLVPVAVATGALDTRRSYVLPAALAGAVGMGALAMFFRALSIGTMGVVAPVAALGVAVPVLVGLGRGETPSGWQLAGIAVAVVGVVLASGPELSRRRGEVAAVAGLAQRPGPEGGASGAVTPPAGWSDQDPGAGVAFGDGPAPGAAAGGPALLLALGAAAGFGLVLLLVAQASTGSAGSVVMTLLTMRLTSVVLLTVLFLAAAGRRGWELHVSRRDLPLLAFMGAADALANACYAIATRSSLLSVAAVLASLYPAVTVLLAFRVHGERMTRTQVTGVGATLAGVLLIAGG